MTKLAHIHKYYYSEEETLYVLDDTDPQADAGEFLAIIGPSGSGKSTLINLLSFIDRKFEGTYLFGDREIGDLSDKELSRIRNEAVGLVFQDFSLIETLTVKENIKSPFLYSGLAPKEAKDRVHEASTKVGLPDKGEKYLKQLSGEQQQCVAIARAIVNRPSFIVADEPTGALDSKTLGEILMLFQQLSNEGVIIILMIHNKETIGYCNYLIKVCDGRILEEVLT